MIVSQAKYRMIIPIIGLFKYDNHRTLSEIVRFAVLIQFIRNITYKNSLNVKLKYSKIGSKMQEL